MSQLRIQRLHGVMLVFASLSISLTVGCTRTTLPESPAIVSKEAATQESAFPASPIPLRSVAATPIAEQSIDTDQLANHSKLELAAHWTQAPAEIPRVLLSDQHRAMCLVGVGDSMPSAELEQLAGSKTETADHFGERATVIYFFKPGQRMSRTGLADMETDVVRKFEKLGVNVLAIAFGDSARAINKLISGASASFPVLLDPQGKFFATIGTEKLPRIYVLDSAGKILWFDIEYSLATRRELQQTLGAVVNR